MLGGFTSILVNVAIGFYIFFKMKTMLAYDNNTIGYSGLVRNSKQKLEEFNLGDIEGTLFYGLGVTEPDAYNLQPRYIAHDEFQQYVTVKFTQKIFDWGKNKIMNQEIDADAPCTIDDFSLDEDSKNNFQQSYGFFPL